MPARRRRETAALFVPLFGAALIVPPVLSVFNVPQTLFGVPLLALYLLAVWIGLVIVTFALSRRLGRSAAGDVTDTDSGTGER